MLPLEHMASDCQEDVREARGQPTPQPRAGRAVALEGPRTLPVAWGNAPVVRDARTGLAPGSTGRERRSRCLLPPSAPCQLPAAVSPGVG